MKLDNLPFSTTDWDTISSVTYPGETGFATWRTITFGDTRIRMVEYSPHYKADHWCHRGHILLVLEGELETDLRDGRRFRLRPGMTYQVSDFGDAPHLSSSKTGAKLFIVD